MILQSKLQWGSEIWPFDLKSGLFECRISKGPVFKRPGFTYGFSCGPNHSKTRPLEFRTILVGFLMVFDKMAAICPDFKWLGLQISVPIWIPDLLQPNLFWTIQNPD